MHADTGSDSWFICFKPNPAARLRLFCFPYAGGGASIFQTWANELPLDVEVVGIQMPGLERRFMEPPVASLSILVQTLASVIFSKSNKPFGFFGHSFGAFISFELARMLSKKAGFRPVHLFVSGIRAPHIPDSNRPIHNLPDDEFLAELHHRYGGIQDETLQNPDIMRELLPGLRANFKMYESYDYENCDSLDCPITAFGGLQDYTVSRADLEAWHYQTKGTFILHMIPGDHFFIHFERQHFLPTLSDEINRTLARLK